MKKYIILYHTHTGSAYGTRIRTLDQHITLDHHITLDQHMVTLDQHITLD